jgi:hypothetical protein
MEAQIPGGYFINETGTRQAQIPGGYFINETAQVAAPAGSEGIQEPTRFRKLGFITPPGWCPY